LGDRLLNAVRSLAFYLEKTVLPFHLSALYPFPRPLSLWTAWFWGSAAVVIGITGFCVWRWRRGERFWLVAWAAYLVMVAPVLGLLQVGRQAAADRYTYLPLLGLYFLAGGGVARFWDRTGRPGAVPLLQPVGAVLGAALLGGLVGLTVHQTAVWKNSETLWRNAVTLYPHRLPTAHLNLGKYYLRHGSLDAAEAEFQAALEIQPQRVEALNGLGQVAYRRGRWDAAESFYVSALRQGPDAIVHNNLGLVYAQLGRDRE
ncbi:MAG: tetratricopeptide repeat protein, partial [Nitrospinaceae bacterium]|nr:tetratricopeptide repeat protein [Nitrospinaceae bacterium]NIR56157.1 tetratricopeptide repeat protein [Nitrospinaceae bacterium]NIS86613.1 tetratricopeptide repeat protein [Nitrospinaceae bacterium]NIT83443.1 tetratricopeptide repeat protein [Nitrospinaceae bacterium]NIU45651.1 tetratricopeptide repeat protein [Nitrospinaceae bacterium]